MKQVKKAVKKAVQKKAVKKAVQKKATQVVLIDQLAPYNAMFENIVKCVGDVEEICFREECMPRTSDLPKRTTKIARGPKSADGSLTIREWVGKKISEGCYTRAQIITMFQKAFSHANQTQGGRYITSAFNDTYCYKRWGKKAQKDAKGIISWVTK